MAFAFLFESVGGGEWLVLLAVILIVVGPKNLPSAARKIGQVMSQLRRAADEFKRQLMSMDQDIHKAVDDVKQEYMNVGQEVQDTVAEDGTSAAGSSGADGSSGDTADTPPYDEDSDRAMWESYGRDYDPEGIYGENYDGSDGSSDASSDSSEQTSDAAEPAVAEPVPAEMADPKPPPSQEVAS
jgi:sec-independent protein translocase protein TatB